MVSAKHERGGAPGNLLLSHTAVRQSLPTRPGSCRPGSTKHARDHCPFIAAGPVSFQAMSLHLRSHPTMDDRLHIAHLVNPVRSPVDSDLTYAQPLTFESMRRAAEQAQDVARIDLLTAQYPDDHAIIPPYFTRTRDLDRCVADLHPFTVYRKLPLIADLVE